MILVNSRLLGSPLDRVFADIVDIPFAFREQFLLTPEAPHDVLLSGEMTEITFPRLLGPIYRVLGRYGMLVPRRANHVPATLHVIARRLADGTPVHEWNRTFWFERRVRFDTTIVWDQTHDDLADLVGRPRMLRMVWAARFAAPGTFTLRSIANALTVRGRVVWLPHWLWPILLGSVDFRQVADPSDPNRVTVDLRVRHALRLTVFRYHGTFTTSRVPKERARP
jgi:Domain of unknown function (DUF4166)